jgi:CBS domain-containing protein
MPGLPGTSPARVIRRRRAARAQRITTTQAVRQAIVSLAGVLNGPVRNQAGDEVGRVTDVVARMTGSALYPPVTGLVIRVGRRSAFLDADAIARLEHRAVILRSSRLDLRDFVRRPGEMLLAQDVLDHQLIDTDGVQVIRAADLYLAPVGGVIRLVGVDVSLQTLLRRLGPRKLRGRPTPDKVIDWSSIAPFGESLTETPAAVRLREDHTALKRLRPGELADLLEDLGREERRDLLARLDLAQAADALEEMEADELEGLLREADPARAALLLSNMEPDEATDALRDLSGEEREELLDAMPEVTGTQLRRLLEYGERTAGGFMTSRLVVVPASTTVGRVRELLVEQRDHHGEIDAVVVVDDDGDLLADVPLYDLVVTPAEVTLTELLDEPQHGHEPITVESGDSVDEVATRFIEARSGSVLVIGEDGRPCGRILADDVIDAMLPDRSRLHFARLRS